jgi:hypothetical protein
MTISERFTHSLRLALCTLALGAGANAAAAESTLPYTYVDVDVISVDAGGGSQSGIGLDGSYSFNDMFYGIASYSDVDTTSSLGVGAGLRGALGQNLHIFGELQFVSVDFGAGSDTGFDLGGGLRGMMTSSLELFGRVDHVDIGGGTDDSLTVGGVYYFDKFGVNFGYTSNDGADSIAVGARFTF